MATAISATNFKAALGECYDAIRSGDFASAKNWYAAAEAQNAGLLLESASDGVTNRRREALAGLKAALEVAEAAGSQASTDGSPFARARTISQ